MPYVNRAVYNYLYYSQGATVISSDETSQGTASTTYTKIKEVTLRNRINPNSKFRVTFTMTRGATAGNINARVYVNEVAVGTEQVTGTAKTWEEDISSTNWGENMRIQVYGKTATGAETCNISNLYIKAVGSQWEKSL